MQLSQEGIGSSPIQMSYIEPPARVELASVHYTIIVDCLEGNSATEAVPAYPSLHRQNTGAIKTPKEPIGPASFQLCFIAASALYNFSKADALPLWQDGEQYGSSRKIHRCVVILVLHFVHRVILSAVYTVQTTCECNTGAVGLLLRLPTAPLYHAVLPVRKRFLRISHTRYVM